MSRLNSEVTVKSKKSINDGHGMREVSVSLSYLFFTITGNGVSQMGSGCLSSGNIDLICFY